MNIKKNTRLDKAEIEYENQLQEWLTNPKNEDLPNELVESKLSVAFNAFINELLVDEDECAEFISIGGRMNELEYLKIIFDYFKSKKIFEAIKKNCAVAFAHESFVESEELTCRRKELISCIESYFDA